jgi:hypothetical protein
LKVCVGSTASARRIWRSIEVWSQPLYQVVLRVRL